MPKDLQHCHALVALVFDNEDDRSSLVSILMGRMNLDATSVDRFTHEGRPGAVIHMRYRARGANMNDMPRRLEAAAKSADVTYDVLHAPSGFSVKRPELEQDVPPRATTEPTEPIQADWTQATAVQAGEARHTLREAVTKFLNLVNDQFHYRVGRPGEAAEDDFEALQQAALAEPTRRPDVGLLQRLFWPWAREGQRGYTSSGVGKLLEAQPATVQERDEAIDDVIEGGARTARLQSWENDVERAALIFRGRDGGHLWLVVHVFERGGRSATWQASVSEWPPQDELNWQQVDDRGRFKTLTAALDEGAAKRQSGEPRPAWMRT